MSFWPKTKRQRDQERAEWRKAKGDVSEDVLMDQSRMRGNTVTRRDQRKGGYDFTETPRNIFGQRTGPDRHVEAKSNPWNSTTPNQDRYAAKDSHWERRDANADSTPGFNVLVDGRVMMNRFKKKQKDGTLFNF